MDGDGRGEAELGGGDHGWSSSVEGSVAIPSREGRVYGPRVRSKRTVFLDAMVTMRGAPHGVRVGRTARL